MAPGNALSPQLAALCPGNVVRRYGFQLPAHAESVGRARQLTLDRLTRWEISGDICETAVLVVSELVTNAVVHTAGDHVICELRDGGGLLRIAVEDQGYGPTGPQLHRPAAAEGESGRGLLLVDAVCSGWGTHDTSGYGPGRVVWAELPCETLQQPEPRRQPAEPQRQAEPRRQVQPQLPQQRGAEPGRTESRRRTEPVRGETVRTETVRKEPVRAEAVRTESVRAETVRAETVRKETHRAAPSYATQPPRRAPRTPHRTEPPC
ncbi:hypothetical protein GCM10009654_21010 [Streptomyces hebeiensis]|uniref:Histidine kinase/HSP90-like ATPase domain-containing protein n=1 Tax=Streptomyces hebeiensis TaxID=229486 RepID=A0ABP4FAN2_9ACTN